MLISIKYIPLRVLLVLQLFFVLFLMEKIKVLGKKFNPMAALTKRSKSKIKLGNVNVKMAHNACGLITNLSWVVHATHQ